MSSAAHRSTRWGLERAFGLNHVDSWLTHWKRPWCWEILKAGGEGDDRGWDGWMASLTPWTWVWASSRSWWWTGRPGMLQSMGLQRVRHDWATELNWTMWRALTAQEEQFWWTGWEIHLFGVCPRENGTKGSETVTSEFFYKRKVRNRQVAERESVFILNVDVGQIRAYL